MSQRKPIIRITAANRDRQKFSVASVWAGNFPGSYSISLDKGSDRYPAIGFFDALKQWASGGLYINVIVESETENRGQPQTRQTSTRNTSGSDGFSDDEIPF